jgi:phospholipid transport system substrate-binding protein
VATRLIVPSETPVSLNYVLHRGKDGWQIINILAEGVSDLALQRSQYQQVMQSTGFDGLLTHLAKKTDDLEAGQK